MSSVRARARRATPASTETTRSLRDVSADRSHPGPPVPSPPPVRSGLVPRERLLQRLVGDRNARVALLAAPAGYGKTTVLAQWAARDERPFAWLTIEKADNDPLRLVGAIAALLDGIAPDAPAVFGSPSAPPPVLPTALELLGQHLRDRETEFVLVLDDVHTLDSSEAVAVISAVAEHLPPGSQLALGARSEPALPLGHLRTHRMLTELRSRDLAMTAAEAQRLLAAMGLELEPGHVATLLDRTEGWPAGLYLAGLSLQEQPDVGAAVARFAGDDRLIADYLRDELLSRLAPQHLRFLMRTSVLDRLCGPLCDAVLERRRSGAALRDMSRSNLLLIPLDRHDEWYRYHTLVLETLRGELHHREPELEADLHRRASAWYAEQDEPDRAIEHALAAGDAARAGELMWAYVPRYLPSGRVLTMRRWLARVPDEKIAAHAPLGLTAAVIALHLGEGDAVEHWTSAAERVLERRPPRNQPAPLRAGVAMMRASLAREGVGRMREDAALAADLLDDDSPWQSLSCMFEGVARHLSGDRNGGRERLEEGARRAAAANAADVQALCLAQLAILREGEADGSEASRAMAQIERAGLIQSPSMALVLAAVADSNARRGRVEEAARVMRSSQLLLAILGDEYGAWYQVEVRVLLARAALRLSDVSRARTLLTEARRFMTRAPDAIVLDELLDETQARADAVQESSTNGSPLLTTAELRVLQLLPTHLSFREIADHIHVSTNTVKTQAHAAYRKLDARSRTEAVDQGRALGLIDEFEAAAP